jgi:IS30 family transposase
LNGAGEYFPSHAQANAEKRKRESKYHTNKCEPYSEEIYFWLCLKKSPEQIAIYLRRRYSGFSVSHETIYQYIYRFQMGWAKLLTRKHEPRWSKRMGKKHSRREMIPNRVWVSERPEAVNAKNEFGHWEGDSVVCSQSVESLNVMVERQSLYVTIRKVLNRKPGTTRDMMIKTLGSFKKGSRKSITLDNGIEFKYHEEVKKALKLKTYFCHPYHSWEKGLVENTNGLIRRFLPKKTDLSKVTDKELRLIEYLLNSTPRKSLGWQTPAEVFAKKSRMKLVNGAIDT